MKSARLTALIATAAVSLATPAGALAAGHPTAAHQATTRTTSQISKTAPSRLGHHPGHKHTSPLPDTGLNLLPETVAGLLMLSAGVGLRAHRSRA